MPNLPPSVAAFLEGIRIVVAGVSRSGSAPANAIFRKLVAAGHEVVPVNPNAGQLEGQPCYPDVGSVPGPSTALSSRPTRLRPSKPHALRSIEAFGTSGSTAPLAQAASPTMPYRSAGLVALSQSLVAVRSCTVSPSTELIGVSGGGYASVGACPANGSPA